MDKRKTELLTVLLSAAFILAMSVWCWIKPAGEYSNSERRYLAQAPKLTLNSILADNSFMDKFETYAVDQFPQRESFRAINAYFNKYILGQSLINGIIVSDGYAAKPEKDLNRQSIDWALSRFQKVNDLYLEDSKVFFSLIPDKSFFMADKSGYPLMDYGDLEKAMIVGTESYATYVDISGGLTLDSYYRTDAHWRQESLRETAALLLKAMGAYSGECDYEEVLASDSFFGVYAGQLAMPLEADKLTYLTNEKLASLKVYNCDSGSPVKMPLYSQDKAEGRDGYEMFLSGAVALITIENPSAEKGRELVIFRDSFGSSIAPLLCQEYSKVTLVDLRYLSSAFLGRFIDFEGADVLFLFSSSVLNNSEGQILP